MGRLYPWLLGSLIFAPAAISCGGRDSGAAGAGASGGSAATGGNAGGGGSAGSAASAGAGGAAGSGASGGDAGSGGAPAITECNDGIDNDGDGLVDWQLDVGCWGQDDVTERSGDRDAEAGWTTFDLSPDSRTIYVSSSGDDANDGLTPATAVATPAKGAELVRDGKPDFLLFRRGDTWRAQDIGADRVVRRFKSGQDAEHRMVVSSYGDSTERPRLEIDKDFIDDDGKQKSFLAVVGLAFISYRKAPGDVEFNGADGGAVRFVGSGRGLLFEDNYLEYGEFTVQNVSQVEVRRNVIYRSYHVGTCAYNSDGSRNPNGDSTYRPSGIFAGGVGGLLIEGNVFDENGWNPDVPGACATIYNHNMYLSGNEQLTIRDNLVLRASSIGVKLSSGQAGDSTDILIENNLFAEGEIGVSMGGNADTPYRFVDAQIRDNVFTDIGRGQPTTRTLSWYMDIIDNDRTQITGNLLVNQPAITTNASGIHLTGGTNRDINISGNVFYDLLRRALVVDSLGAWSNVGFADNVLATTSTLECLIDHNGGFAALSYSGNEYRSGAPADTWFCIAGARNSLAQWTAASGETGASQSSFVAPNPGRNLESYVSSLGLGATLPDFAREARSQSRHRFRPELMAAAANNYVRLGFGQSAR